ncbi:MAG: PDZ domain-containing protein [Acidobacteriota bacterium]
MKRLIVLLPLVCLMAASVLEAQQVLQRRIDPSTSLMMMELGAIAELEEGGGDVVLTTVLPKAVRPESNRALDVRQGDAVLMMNGERIRSLEALRELYEATPEGDEVKLALKRDARRFLVAFAKSSAETGSGTGAQVRVVRAGPGGGDVELLHEAHALLGEAADQVRVLALLTADGELEEGDVLVAVDGQAVAALADFRKAYQATPLGGSLDLTWRRGEETLELEVTKAERPAGMVIR